LQCLQEILKISLTLNNKAYIGLLRENIAWLKQQSHSLEKDHLITICEYEIKKRGFCFYCDGNIVMFNSDLDICDSCKRQFFPGESA
jgi:hypothetical protein